MKKAPPPCKVQISKEFYKDHVQRRKREGKLSRACAEAAEQGRFMRPDPQTGRLERVSKQMNPGFYKVDEPAYPEAWEPYVQYSADMQRRGDAPQLCCKFATVPESFRRQMLDKNATAWQNKSAKEKEKLIWQSWSRQRPTSRRDYLVELREFVQQLDKMFQELKEDYQWVDQNQTTVFENLNKVFRGDSLRIGQYQACLIQQMDYLSNLVAAELKRVERCDAPMERGDVDLEYRCFNPQRMLSDIRGPIQRQISLVQGMIELFREGVNDRLPEFERVCEKRAAMGLSANQDSVMEKFLNTVNFVRYYSDQAQLSTLVRSAMGMIPTVLRGAEVGVKFGLRTVYLTTAAVLFPVLCIFLEDGEAWWALVKKMENELLPSETFMRELNQRIKDFPSFMGLVPSPGPLSSPGQAAGGRSSSAEDDRTKEVALIADMLTSEAEAEKHWDQPVGVKQITERGDVLTRTVGDMMVRGALQFLNRLWENSDKLTPQTLAEIRLEQERLSTDTPKQTIVLYYVMGALANYMDNWVCRGMRAIYATLKSMWSILTFSFFWTADQLQTLYNQVTTWWKKSSPPSPSVVGPSRPGTTIGFPMEASYNRLTVKARGPPGEGDEKESGERGREERPVAAQEAEQGFVQRMLQLWKGAPPPSDLGITPPSGVSPKEQGEIGESMFLDEGGGEGRRKKAAPGRKRVSAQEQARKEGLDITKEPAPESWEWLEESFVLLKNTMIFILEIMKKMVSGAMTTAEGLLKIWAQISEPAFFRVLASIILPPAVYVAAGEIQLPDATYLPPVNEEVLEKVLKDAQQSAEEGGLTEVEAAKRQLFGEEGEEEEEKRKLGRDLFVDATEGIVPAAERKREQDRVKVVRFKDAPQVIPRKTLRQRGEPGRDRDLGAMRRQQQEEQNRELKRARKERRLEQDIDKEIQRLEREYQELTRSEGERPVTKGGRRTRPQQEIPVATRRTRYPPAAATVNRRKSTVSKEEEYEEEIQDDDEEQVARLPPIYAREGSLMLEPILVEEEDEGEE